jgi:hypothetical protein
MRDRFESFLETKVLLKSTVFLGDLDRVAQAAPNRRQKRVFVPNIIHL